MPDFETIVEETSVLFTAIDGAGQITYQNPVIEAICGHSPESVVGEPFQSFIHPDDQFALTTLIEDPTTDEDRLDFRFRDSNSQWAWLTTVGQPTRDPASGDVVLTSRDATQRKERERRLERFEVILDSIDDGVYAIEPDGTIVYINDAYATMKGVDRESLIGTNIYSWGSVGAAQRISNVRTELESGERETGVVEFDFTTVEGEPIPTELHFGSVTQPGNELERVGVLRDVSTRKAREHALERKNEQLENFASIVSHDLRNPLNVASGRVDLAQRDCESEHLDSVTDALLRMDNLIDDLLTLARQGEEVGDLESVELDTIVNAGWQSVDTAEATVEIDSTCTFSADRTRVIQLLENLIRNAVEHGGTDVTVRVGAIDGGFFLEDDGPGIPESERADVLEAGYSTSSGGTGFGLSIVKQISDAHGWDLRLEEGTDGGARFVFLDVENAG